MSYSTIYDMRTAHVLTDGVQSQAMCDATINTARYLARERKHSVIVEDRDRGMLPSHPKRPRLAHAALVGRAILGTRGVNRQ
jgi:hypothetical protein